MEALNDWRQSQSGISQKSDAQEQALWHNPFAIGSFSSVSSFFFLHNDKESISRYLIHSIDQSSEEKHNGGALLHGTFDEEAGHKEFLQALHAWRSGGCVDNQGTNQSYFNHYTSFHFFFLVSVIYPPHLAFSTCQ